MNLLITVPLLSRANGKSGMENIAGYIVNELILPLSIATVLNITSKRECWTIVLLTLVVVFLIEELILDYMLVLDFINSDLL
jgi:uncharacterized membrane protein YdbT with pleckstrin-like domain